MPQRVEERMMSSVADWTRRHKNLAALEARAALGLAERLVDGPFTRRASLWLDALLVLSEADGA